MMSSLLRWAGCILVAAVTSVVVADEPVPATIIPTDYVVLPAVGEYGRLPLHRDALEAQIVAGSWKSPEAGDTVEALDGKQEIWQAVTARDGALDTRSLRGGYAFTTFEAPADGAMLLAASGHASVYVNGELRAGDPYKLGWLQLPVHVQKGRNTLLFHLASDKLSARLTTPNDDVILGDADRTLPTILRGEKKPAWAAIPVLNTTDDILNNIQIVCRTAGDKSLTTPIGRIPPLSICTAVFEVPAVDEPEGHHMSFEVILAHGDDYRPLARTELALRVVDANDVNIRTFRSRIDGSVQSYAIRPAQDSSELKLATPGVVVTLHDAGVPADEHLARYTPKSWAHVLAPQGRRSYGFDWEAWSRTDVLEAMADASARYPCDPLRTCLTGYGMGGHGVWHLGVTFPDRFAAIGPSAGWISFWSYGGGMPSFANNNPAGIEAMLLRGYAPSDTVKLLSNLAGTGVYLLHDSAEVGVPVEQARYLRERLAAFHTNFVYLEPSSADAAANNASGDWPQMMEFFEHARRPTLQEQMFVDFTTANPGVSADCDWVKIDAQVEQLVPSRSVIHQNRDTGAFTGTTTNVARLAIELQQLRAGQTVDVTLDGVKLARLRRDDENGLAWFERQGEKWAAAEAPAPAVKNSTRNGTFNAVIDHDPLLVYGTQGNQDENRWAETKARFDAETFYYRANGALEVLPDSQFDPAEHHDRNVILYGNADTNSAWAALLTDCPVELTRGAVRVGEHNVAGDNLAVLMVRPRPGSNKALVAVVGGTGLSGMRLTNRLRWFVSGITYPDLAILGPKVLTEGIPDIRAWGFFGPDWKADDAELAWRVEFP
jgi:hypothetical protein